MINWSEKLDNFGKSVLRSLNVDPNFLPSGYNPITKALADDANGWLARWQEMDGYYKIALSRVAVVCQMNCYDARGGPERDGARKALRRHWYDYYKVAFAQPMCRALGETFKERNWFQRQSITYAELVDSTTLTYNDLWVEDASRMMEENWKQLFKGCHILVVVEKDSLYGDFQIAAKALGAASLYSSKGKSSKAAIERLLRNHFNWTPSHDPFAYEPLIILHITDYDYDGESVIGPTVAQQARRYTDNILEARVGIEPYQVEIEQWPTKWYDVKTHNAAYIEWAERNGLFAMSCFKCGERWLSRGAKNAHCPACSNEHLDGYGDLMDRAHGLEVEALQTRAYYELLVDALLTVLPFNYIVEQLREECKANAYEAARAIAEEIYRENFTYQAILKEFDRLEEIKREFENRVCQELEELGQPHEGDWESLEENPKIKDFQDHVSSAGDWTGPWRPFDRALRTAKLTGWLRDDAWEEIDQFAHEEIQY